MFYFKDGRWRPFTKKATYTKTIEEYDNDVLRFEGKDNLIIEDAVFTEDELIKLEIIKNVEHISLVDVIAFVKGSELRDEKSPELIEAEAAEEERAMLTELIDIDTTPAEVLQKMKVLIKKYDTSGFYKQKDLIEYDDKLYVVLQTHQAQLDWTPDKTPSLYSLKLTSEDGTPKQWVQPNSTNPYQIGDKVLHNNKTWINETPNNVWEPGVYGWKAL